MAWKGINGAGHGNRRPGAQLDDPPRPAIVQKLAEEGPMDITELLTEDRIIHLRKEKTKADSLKALLKVLAKTDEVTKEKELAKAISDRERILSTGIGQCMAIPHAKIPSVSRFIAAMGISKEGIPFDSLDGKPVNVIVMIAGPEGKNEEYLRILARFVAILKPEQTRQRILAAKGAAQILDILQEIK